MPGFQPWTSVLGYLVVSFLFHCCSGCPVQAVPYGVVAMAAGVYAAVVYRWGRCLIDGAAAMAVVEVGVAAVAMEGCMDSGEVVLD